MEQISKINKNTKLVKVLIGNKSDITGRAVTEDEAKERAESYEFLYFEASAKTGHKVKEIFQKTVDQICKLIDEKAWGE